MPSLVIWMNGQRVGTWSTGKSDASTFNYDATWTNSEFFRAQSLSIPVTADLEVRAPSVTYYFDNLLPPKRAGRLATSTNAGGRDPIVPTPRALHDRDLPRGKQEAHQRGSIIPIDPLLR